MLIFLLIMIQHFEFHMSIEKLANLVYSLVFGSLLVFCSIFNSGYGSLIFLFRSHWFWWFSYVPLRKQFLPESLFLVSVFSRTCHWLIAGLGLDVNWSSGLWLPCFYRLDTVRLPYLLFLYNTIISILLMQLWYAFSNRNSSYIYTQMFSEIP
jgi:hypothetical protein